MGGPARPSALLIGELPGGVIDAVAELLPSTLLIDDVADMRQAEWDAAVQVVPPPLASIVYRPVGGAVAVGVADHLNVLALVDAAHDDTVDTFNEHQAPGLAGRNTTRRSSVRVRSLRRRCTQFERPAHPDAELNELLENHLLPVVRQRDRYWFLIAEDKVPAWTPLLRDGDGHALAATYRRGPAGGETLLIPADAQRLDRWVRWAFRRWRVAEPGRFGGLRDWHIDETWMTTPERTATRRLADYRRRGEQLKAALSAERAEIDAELGHARAAAATGWRRLLTASGDMLVDVVEDALHALGFHVERTDDRPTRKGDKLQDLDVTDPASPGWIAIAEVKGYTGGAKLGDLTAIERYTTRYTRDHDGAMPDRRWYIVNHRYETAPADRPPPLDSQPTDVAAFSGAAGAVIDTRTLFQLVVTHEASADDDKAALRTLLRERRGLWPLEKSAGDP